MVDQFKKRVNEMTQLEKLKANLLAARKEKNEVAKNLYAYLIGQCTLKSKEPSDEEVWNTLKSYVKSVSLHAITGEALVVRDSEIKLISEFLPSQLTDVELADEVTKLKVVFDVAANFKLVVKHFQDNFTGRYSPGNLRAAWESVK